MFLEATHSPTFFATAKYPSPAPNATATGKSRSQKGTGQSDHTRLHGVPLRRVGHDLEVVLREVHGTQREQRKKQERDQVSYYFGDATPDRPEGAEASTPLARVFEFPPKFVTKLTAKFAAKFTTQFRANLRPDAVGQILQVVEAQTATRSGAVDTDGRILPGGGRSDIGGQGIVQRAIE